MPDSTHREMEKRLRVDVSRLRYLIGPEVEAWGLI
jgi:hypothetical protein